jgi:hypothetical protein
MYFLRFTTRHLSYLYSFSHDNCAAVSITADANELLYLYYIIPKSSENKLRCYLPNDKSLGEFLMVSEMLFYTSLIVLVDGDEPQSSPQNLQNVKY